MLGRVLAAGHQVPVILHQEVGIMEDKAGVVTSSQRLDGTNVQ